MIVKKQWSKRGSALLYVTGIILLISIVIAGSLVWQQNFSKSQLNLASVELVASEKINVERIIQAVARKNLWANESNIFKDLKTEIEANTTRNPRQSGSNQGGVFLVDLVYDPLPSWMSSSTFTRDHSPNPDNPLFYLYGVLHQLKVAYTLGAKETASDTNFIPDTLQQTTSTLNLKEIPTCQVQLTAVDELDTTLINFPIQITGTSFFPYGITGGNAQQSGAMMSTHTVIPKPWTAGSSFSSPSARIHPAISASWLIDPYTLVDANSENNFANQKFYPKCEYVMQFDGQDLISAGDLPSGITVEVKAGMKRVVINLAQLVGNNGIFVDCTTPLAKHRGVYIIGDDSADNHGADLIATNGAVHLFGQQPNTDLLLATSYGGITFTSDTYQQPTWRAYIAAPILPPKSFYTVASTSAAQSLGMDSAGVNYDTVEFSGTWQANQPLTLGFAYSFEGVAGVPNSCWVEIVPASDQVRVHGINTRSLPVQIEAVNADMTPGQAHTFYVSYNRTDNSLSGRIVSDTTVLPFYVNLDINATRYETPIATWDFNGATVTNFAVTARSGGLGLYKKGTVLSAKIVGGILVGKRITGNLESLLIEAPPAGNPFSIEMLNEWSDRFLLLDP